jgi:4'-phosphopantetheinyl transferase
MIYWQSVETAPQLSAEHIHVWRLPVCVAAEAVDWLDAGERARLDAMAAAGQMRMLATRAGLRQVLAGYLGCAPAEVPLAVAEGGKPYIAGGPQFNLSHGGELAMLAVAQREVGIDVELQRPVPRALAIARRVLDAATVERLAALPAAELDDAFLAAWTAMEARQKCLGQGVFGRHVGSDEVGGLAFEPDLLHLAHLAWADAQHQPDIKWLALAS